MDSKILNKISIQKIIKTILKSVRNQILIKNNIMIKLVILIE